MEGSPGCFEAEGSSKRAPPALADDGDAHVGRFAAVIALELDRRQEAHASAAIDALGRAGQTGAVQVAGEGERGVASQDTPLSGIEHVDHTRGRLREPRLERHPRPSASLRRRGWPASLERKDRDGGAEVKFGGEAEVVELPRLVEGDGLGALPRCQQTGPPHVVSVQVARDVVGNR